jgi:nicotinamidase/pyrazinamidase
VSVADETLAELMAVVVSGRPDSLVDVGLGGAEPAIHEAFRDIREALAAVALAEPPAQPSRDLRSRILQSLAASRPAPTKRALLVVDMQNDHLTPGRPLEVPRARDIVPAIAVRLDAARREKMPIVYVVDQHEAGDADLDVWGAHNIKGSEGAEILARPGSQAGRLGRREANLQRLHPLELGRCLGELRVDTLVLTGCLTELGLLATATDALQRGFAVEVPPKLRQARPRKASRSPLESSGSYGPLRAGASPAFWRQ